MLQFVHLGAIWFENVTFLDVGPVSDKSLAMSKKETHKEMFCVSMQLVSSHCGAMVANLLRPTRFGTSKTLVISLDELCNPFTNFYRFAYMLEKLLCQNCKTLFKVNLLIYTV